MIGLVTVSRGLRSVLLMVFTLKFVASEEGVPAIVHRRLSGDTYRYLDSGNLTDLSICHDDGNLTFIVGERRCVKNQELINDCEFAFSPEIERTFESNFRLAVQITQGDGTKYEQLKTYTFDSEVRITNATIVTAENTRQLVTQQFCHIVSLEVYRERGKFTEISKIGFLLTNRGTIEVDHMNLTYNISEYEGELYRMNLSCFGEGLSLPLNGCLFFKVIGRADITNAKFNSVVKGTLDKGLGTLHDQNMKTSTVTNAITTIANSSVFFTVTVSDNSNIFEIGSITFFVVVGAAGGVLSLLVIILILCIIIGCLVFGTERSLPCTTTAPAQAQLQSQASHSPFALQQESVCNIPNVVYDTIVHTNIETLSDDVYNEEWAPQTTNETNVSLKLALEDQNRQHEKLQHEHTQACESPSDPTLTALRQSTSQENNFDVVTFETFKTKDIQEKCNKQSASWSSGSEQKTKIRRSFGDEQEHIYDTIQPSKVIRATEEGKNLESSNQGYCMLQKVSVNSTSFYASLTSNANSTYDVPRKATSVYNITDTGEKAEQHQKIPWHKLKATSTEILLSSIPLEGHYDFPKTNWHEQEPITIDLKDSR